MDVRLYNIHDGEEKYEIIDVPGCGNTDLMLTDE